ncbi:hypothetical protein B566_EDAN017530 [Ephemera danica]|nr:hypothetical protein B566_EDAN017530 [Ephemera danica]
MVHIAIMDKIKRGGSQQSSPPAATSGPPRSSRHRRYTVLLQGTSKKLTLHVKNLADGPGTIMARSCTRGLPRHQSLAILVIAALALAGMVQHSPTVTLQTLSDPLNSTEFAAYVANTSYVIRHCSGGGEKTNHTVRHVVENVPMLDEDGKISALHSSFLWGAMVSPLAGWLLARRIGAKLVFAWGIIIAGGSSLFVPAVWGTKVHIFLRILQGYGTVRIIYLHRTNFPIFIYRELMVQVAIDQWIRSITDFVSG